MANEFYALSAASPIDAATQANFMPTMSRYINHYALAAGVATTVTWPAGYNFCKITAPNTFYCRADGVAATLPSATVTDGTGSAPMSQRHRGLDTTFSVIGSTSQILTIEFWK